MSTSSSVRSSLVDGPEGDVVTCMACRAEGYGIGFAHKCDPIAAQKERAAIVAMLRDVVSVRRERGADAAPTNLVVDLIAEIEKGKHHAE